MSVSTAPEKIIPVIIRLARTRRTRASSARRQFDQGCAVAPPRNTQAAADDRQRHIVCWNEPTVDLARQDPLAGEIEVCRAESRDHFRGRASGRYFGRTVITDIDIRNFVYHPEPWRIAKPAARKACRPKMLHTWDMERLIAADVAHPESPKRTKQYRKGGIATIDPRTKPIQVSREIPLEQLMDEVDRLRRDQLAIFIGRRNAGGP